MKKTVFGILCGIALLCLVCVFLIGGQIGAYAWNLGVFVIAPLAVAATVIEAVVLMIALIKKRKIAWKVLFLGVFAVLALPITVLFGVSPIVYPTTAPSSDAVVMAMPVDNGILFGGETYKTHAMWPSECYAYDILKKPYDLGSAKLEDYGIFGCEVTAPIAGRVIALENGQKDIPPNTEEFSSALGNYIVVKIEDTGTYLLLAHLQKGSVLPKCGEEIKKGQIIAAVGNSGTTSEPHLHIQHQRNNPLEMKFPLCAEGLPIVFEQ